MAAVKIATCCYCGARAALVLRGKERHELACGTCGAPLRMLKMLPVGAVRPPVTAAKPARSAPRKRVERDADHHVPRPRKRRKTKRFGRRMLSELWDVLEDVVEEVFD